MTGNLTNDIYYWIRRIHSTTTKPCMLDRRVVVVKHTGGHTRTDTQRKGTHRYEKGVWKRAYVVQRMRYPMRLKTRSSKERRQRHDQEKKLSVLWLIDREVSPSVEEDQLAIMFRALNSDCQSLRQIALYPTLEHPFPGSWCMHTSVPSEYILEIGAGKRFKRMGGRPEILRSLDI